MPRTTLALGALLLCLGTPTVAQETGTDDSCTEPLTIIENVRVFDGLEVIPEATVVIRCTLIDSVTRGNEAAARPAGSIVVDGRGKTLLPGLIDSHTHTFRRSMLERSLDFGVTTVFDMGSLASSFKAEMDAEVAQGAIRDRADMRGAVLWVTAPGSHGTQFGDAPTLTNPEDADEFVDRLIADGADYIKVIYDNFKMIDRPVPTLSKKSMQAVVDAAHRHGVMAVVHSRDVDAYADAAEAGADGFVHVPVDEVPGSDLVSLLHEKGIFVSPNLSGMTRTGQVLLDDDTIGPMLTENEIENLKNFRQKHREGGELIAYDSVRIFHESGLDVLAATDTPNAGTTVGASMHVELELVVEVGLSTIDALAAATSTPARVFGLDDRGRIAEGLLADLLLVEGSPDQAITDTRNIVSVWKAGKAHLREVAAGDSD